MESGFLKIKKSNVGLNIRIALLIYIAIIHYLYIFIYPKTFEYSYRGLLYISDFNWDKYIFCIFTTLLLYRSSLTKIENNRFSETIMLILNLLYFIPGMVFQAATNASWGYIIYYFLFWCGMELWLKLIKPRLNGGHRFRLLKITNNIETYVLAITIFAIAITFFFALYTKTFFSVSNLIATLGDVYGVRAAAKENSMHWLLVTLEYWAAYYIIIVLAYYVEKRKWWLVIFLTIAEINLFLIQANRILLFLAIISIIVGLVKVNNNKIVYLLMLVACFLVIETLIDTKGLLLTDIFRRYAVVPNRLSEQYYDYFLTHTPDYLRAKYVRIFSFLGMKSPYYDYKIGDIIGEIYYGLKMNCNTGLVGGSAFEFGILGPIISTFGYVFSFRLFENSLFEMKNNSLYVATTIMLSTIVINLPALLASVFSISYMSLLFLSLIPLCRSWIEQEKLDEQHFND